jgi:hypothetical protein
MLAHAHADLGTAETLPLLRDLESLNPMEASALRARYLWRTGRLREAADALTTAFRGFRKDPWSQTSVVEQALRVAGALSFTDPMLAKEMYASLEEPFALYVADDLRKLTLLDLASMLDHQLHAKTIEAFEPHVPWEKRFLQLRFSVYRSMGHPLTTRAERELAEFLKHEAVSFGEAITSGMAP